MNISRRRFNSLALGTVSANAVKSLWGREASHADSNGRYFYFAVVADSHIIDHFYHGHESSAFDTESLYHTAERLCSARKLINSLDPPIEQVFLVGDYFHNYPSPEYDFYFANVTRLDNAKSITDKFRMPVHIGFGNHDYDVPDVPREMSHRLFEAKFKTSPYYVVDYKSFKFVHLNNFLGDTWNFKSQSFDRSQGSLGRTQLEWFEGQLQQGMPTFVFIHYPLLICSPTEVSDYGLHPLIRKYQDNILCVVSGHWHKWIDFAHTYGPQHYVIAATRYDANAYMLVEVDRDRKSWRFINSNLVEWSTHYSRPFVAS